MIRTLHGTGPTRRIAIIENSRLGRARLRGIGNGLPSSAAVSWAPTRPQELSPSDIWQGFILQSQAAARATTPGTLEFTPAPEHFIPPINGPWNSWGTLDCAAPAAEPKPKSNLLLVLAAVVTTAAAATYIANEILGGEK